MQGERSVKRRRAVNEKTDTVSRSNALSYFDTLSQEVVAHIVTYFRTRWKRKWSKYELFENIGIFRDILRCSFTVASISVWKKGVEVVRDGQLFKKGNDFMHVWGHYFTLANPKISDACRNLRSVRLDIRIKNDIPSLDVLFASCGGVLQELELHCNLSSKESLNSIFNSVARHCLSLQTLSLMGTNWNFEYLPLFRSIGGGLRCLCLIISNKPPRSMWQHCTRLEELELSSVEDLSFVADIQSSLRVITFCECPTADELRTLIGFVPDVGIRVNEFIDIVEFGQVINVCGKQLRTLHWYSDEPELPSDVGNSYSSLINLEYLSLRTERCSMNFLDSFFVAPKPNLRKLQIGEEASMNIFDFLATKITSLETLVCNVKAPDNPMNDSHLSNFLSMNKRLQCLTIYYRTIVGDERTAKKWEASFERNTVQLIRSLKGYTALRKLRISREEWPWIRKQRYEMIADACVGFRRRGLDIQVNGIHYLKN